MTLDGFLSEVVNDCINGESGTMDKRERAYQELRAEREQIQREADEYRAIVAKAKAEGDPLCSNCGCRESEHLYSGPTFVSADGLPEFDGCYGAGVNHTSTDPDWDYVTPICPCSGFSEAE